MRRTPKNPDGLGASKVSLTWDNALKIAGLVIIGFEAINAEILSGTFHPEFLLCGLALCGIGIAQGIDRSEKK